MSNELKLHQIGLRRPEYSIEFAETVAELNPVISPTASYHMNGKLHSLLTALVGSSINRQIPLTFFISDHPYTSNFTIKDCGLSPEDALTKATLLGTKWVEKCKEENKDLFDKLDTEGVRYTFITACDFYKDNQNIINVLNQMVHYLLGIKDIKALVASIPRNDEQLVLPNDSAQKAFVIAVHKRFRKIKHDEQNNVLRVDDNSIIVSTINRFVEETVYMLFWQLTGKKHICYPISEDKDSIPVFNIFDVVLERFLAYESTLPQPLELVTLKDEFFRLTEEKKYVCNFKNRLKVCDVRYTKLPQSPKKENGGLHTMGNQSRAVPHQSTVPSAPYLIHSTAATAAANPTILSTSAPSAPVLMSSSSQPRMEASFSWPQTTPLAEVDHAFLALLTQTAGCTDKILTPVAADNTVALLLALRRRRTCEPDMVEGETKEKSFAPRDAAPRRTSDFFPPARPKAVNSPVSESRVSAQSSSDTVDNQLKDASLQNSSETKKP